MATWFTLGVLVVSPGARVVIPKRVRLVASVSTMSDLRLAPTWVVVSGDGASLVTVTVSCTVARESPTSTGTVAPTPTVTVFSLLAKPLNSNVAL